MTERTIINIDEVPLAERGNGKQFAVKWGRVGPLLGLAGLGCAVHVVPPGKKAFPFHRHHVMDELFFVLSGKGEYRFGDSTLPIRSGDIVAAPAGTQAHQLVNTGSEELRYFGISTMAGVDVVDYPDSGKIAVAAGVKNADFKTATYVGLGRITAADYYDGEDA
ncbi:MAG: cupin domain-containing protein [Xanthobacteraceae bacterium]